MWDDILAVACETAVAAGQLLRQKWSQPRTLTSKGFRDIVTDADFASQELITRAVQRAFPSHGFLPEEEDGSLPTSGDYLWVIDPVDGTSNYSRQMSNFCVSIGVVEPTVDDKWRPIVGVIYDPMNQELFSAKRGQGAWLGSPTAWQETQLQVAPTSELIQSICSLDWSHSPEKRERTLQIATPLAHSIKTMRGLGSAALALAWIAAGRLDAYFNLNLHPWDVAAGVLLVTEAGGQITNTNGQLWELTTKETLASNGNLHHQLLEITTRFPAPT